MNQQEDMDVKELEKLREEIGGFLSDMQHDLNEFKERTESHMAAFRSAMNRAREIERQAGIGEEK